MADKDAELLAAGDLEDARASGELFHDLDLRDLVHLDSALGIGAPDNEDRRALPRDGADSRLVDGFLAVRAPDLDAVASERGQVAPVGRPLDVLDWPGCADGRALVCGYVCDPDAPVLAAGRDAMADKRTAGYIAVVAFENGVECGCVGVPELDVPVGGDEDVAIDPRDGRDCHFTFEDLVDVFIVLHEHRASEGNNQIAVVVEVN